MNLKRAGRMNTLACLVTGNGFGNGSGNGSPVSTCRIAARSNAAEKRKQILYLQAQTSKTSTKPVW